MFHIPRYNKWQDVLCFDWASTSHLLQARKCIKCGAAHFRIVATESRAFPIATCGVLRKEHLATIGFFLPTTPAMPVSGLPSTQTGEAPASA
jgi:hypothetical protein